MPTVPLVVGIIFGPLPAAMAFVITYEEWSHHGLARPELIKRSLHLPQSRWGSSSSYLWPLAC
jgi:hypothetical protein